MSAGRFVIRHATPSTVNDPLHELGPLSSSEEANLSPAAAYKSAIKTKLWPDGTGDSSTSSGI